MNASAPPLAASRVQYAAATDSAGLRLRGHAVVPGADPGDPARVTRRLVFRERDGEAERSLPLDSRPEPDLPPALRGGGWLRCAGFAVEAALADESLALHDGTWDLYVETAVDGGPPRRQRLAADRVQVKDQDISVQPSGDYRYQPHLTVHGNLSVLVRGVGGHVEVSEIWVRDHTVEVRGELTGVEQHGDLPVVARRRDDAETAPVEADWSSGRVRASVDLLELAARDASAGEAPPEAGRPRLWDLVVPAVPEHPGRPELRFGTYLDDVAQKQDIVVYPARDFATAGDVRRLRPYYTVRNTVAISSSRADIPRGASE